MKKITLAFIALFIISFKGQSQVITTFEGPQYDGSWSTLAGPSGSANAVFHRACYLVKATELTDFALTNSIVTQFGFQFLNGVSVPTSGQFTVYLQNTSDATYTKGNNFTAALTGMSTNFNGTYAIPVSAGASSVYLTLNTPFTYTGGGIYVAYEWSSTAPTSTTPARYLCNTIGLTTGGGYSLTTTNLAAANTMTLSQFRPAFLWRASNTATNELSVTNLSALGKVSKQFTAGHPINVQIRNNSNIAKTNVPVFLAITGANPFTASTTIANVAAGALANASFPLYNPTVNGANNMTVTLGPDQDNTNNAWAWTQTVTCTDLALIPPVAASTFTDEQRGLNNAIYSYKMTPPSDASLTGVYMAVSTESGSIGQGIYGVLMDPAGTILATTQTVIITAAMQCTNNVFATCNFNPPVLLTGGTAYHIGMAQAGTGYFPFGNFYPGYPVGDFYLNPIGSAPALVDRGYMGIGAVVNFSISEISAVASKTNVCRNQPVTFTVSGNTPANTYTWTGGTTGSTLGITTTTVTGPRSYSVVGTNTTTGCRTTQAVVTISVGTCNWLGLTSNGTIEADIAVYPNPTKNGIVNVQGLVGKNSIQVMNLLGQVVFNTSTEEETLTFDLNDNASGSYLIKITNSEGQSKMIKVVKE